MILDDHLPAGNIRLLDARDDGFTLAPDLRDTEGFWFYWKFRVRGARGRRLTFRFAEHNCLTARGPAVSKDRGASWHWLYDTPDAPEDHFAYAFGDTDEEVHFSMCIPYGPSEWSQFTQTLSPTSEHAAPTPTSPPRLHTLCHTSKGLKVPLLEIPGPAGAPWTLLTARHHCCETPANFVMEGLLRRWLDLRPGPLLALPFMDFQGVVDGDQGKNRQGRDHNRDYGPDSRYPEVLALKSLVARRRGPFHALDLHAPWIRHGINERVYFPGPRDPRLAAALDQFSARLEPLARGLPFHAADNLPFGQGWNTGQNYHAGLSSTRWMGQQPECRLAATLETPYANAAGTPVTPDRARALGESLAEALASFSENPPG